MLSVGIINQNENYYKFSNSDFLNITVPRAIVLIDCLNLTIVEFITNWLS